MKRPRFLRKLFTRRADKSVAKVKSDVVALPNWEPLLHALRERAQMLQENQVFMVRLKNPRSKLVNREHSTLIIGRLKSLPVQSPEVQDFFMTAMGELAAGLEPGSEDANWQRLGFQLEKTRQSKSFGFGPASAIELNEVLTAALDSFHVFYGVSMDSRI